MMHAKLFEVKDYNYVDAIVIFDDGTNIRATFELRHNGTQIVFIDARGYQVLAIPDGVEVVQRFLGAPLPRVAATDFFVPVYHSCYLSVHGVERFRLVSLSNCEHAARHVVELTEAASDAEAPKVIDDNARRWSEAKSLLETARDCSSKTLDATRAFFAAADKATAALAARAAAKVDYDAAQAASTIAMKNLHLSLLEDTSI